MISPQVLRNRFENIKKKKEKFDFGLIKEQNQILPNFNKTKSK